MPQNQMYDDLLAKVSELEKQNDYDEKVHESKLANYEQLHNQLQTKVSEQEKEIEDLKKYPGPEWISFDDHRDKIHEQSKELASLRSENERLVSENEAMRIRGEALVQVLNEKIQMMEVSLNLFKDKLNPQK